MLRDCRDAIWFEDYNVGDAFESAPVTFTEPEIIDFGKRYDPQPFHIDPDAAKASPFAGLIASGTQILPLVWGAIMAPGFLNGRALGAPGIALEFKRPVRPGDTLVAISRVLRNAPLRDPLRPRLRPLHLRGREPVGRPRRHALPPADHAAPPGGPGLRQGRTDTVSGPSGPTL